MTSSHEPHGLIATVHTGPPARLANAIEVDVGGRLPVAFTGIRRVLRALADLAPELIASARTADAAEWSYLFPETSAARAPLLLELASAPNQRRLYRESEQSFRVLNFAARSITSALRALRRPLVLRNAGECDLVSLRGFMHAVEYSRLELEPVMERFVLSEWGRASEHASILFAPTRAAHMERICRRIGCAVESAGSASRAAHSQPLTSPTCLEDLYLTELVDSSGSCEQRLAAAIHALRACFFSTNYEGASLAAETGLALLHAADYRINTAALTTAWTRLDRPDFDIPMIELDQTSLADADTLRALFQLHLGMTCVFCGELSAAIDHFRRGLACTIAPERVAHLHMYRALTLTKRMGQIEAAQAEIAAGLRALRGSPRAAAALSEGWLRNLLALTYFREQRFDEARREEELAIACVDGMAGGSAAHLKTNLVSNLSALAEGEGNISRAILIWRLFEPLNQALGSHHAHKVYAYRLGALEASAGEFDPALRAYETALEHADASGDRFHGEIIAAAIGRLYLARRDTPNHEAEHWYRCAVDRARSIGDCVALAKDLAGLALARGECSFAAARACLSVNAGSDLAGLALPKALVADDATAVLSALPATKSKLPRPFDLINV